MDFIRLKNKLKMSKLLFSELLNKSEPYKKWKAKRDKVVEIANLLTWSQIPKNDAERTLNSFSAIYDTFSKVALSPESQTWEWNSYRAFEAKIKNKPEALSIDQRTLTAVMFQDCMWNVFAQYKTWRQEVPEELQIYVLTHQPHMLPSLSEGITPGLAEKHTPELWSVWTTLSTMYDKSDRAIQQHLLYDWLDNKTLPAGHLEKIEEALPADFA